MEIENRVTISLKRYEELLNKEYMANSILNNNYITTEQIKWLKDNYNATIKNK